MYSLAGYGHMIDDRVRMDAYSQALRKTVRPGSVVLDIGTGPGVFAVLACQLGAKRVYALEPDPIIQVGREIAMANGCADRIQFIEDISTRVTLPMKADVIVSDLRGVMPLFQHHLPSIADARRRLLAPGGKLIPKRDAIWVSVVEGPEQYGKIVDCWEKNPLQQDLSAARQLAVNEFQKSRFNTEQLLAQPQLWATLDYETLDSPDVCSTLDFSVERAGTGHGLAGWFDTCLMDGIGYSNAPGTVETVYGSMFLPWPEPVSLCKGQNVRVDISATLRENDYLWRWTTEVASPDDSAPARRFDQSQLGGAVLSLAKLHQSASDYVPRLSEEGRVNRRTLELMDGKNSLEQIARQIAAEFPGRFAQHQKAFAYAAGISQQRSE